MIPGANLKYALPSSNLATDMVINPQHEDVSIHTREKSGTFDEQTTRFDQPSSDEYQVPEMVTLDVELVKDSQGLGVTIAGYTCEREELSGIFVKSVTEGSAGAQIG